MVLASPITTSMSCSTMTMVRSLAMRRTSSTVERVSLTLMPAVGSVGEVGRQLVLVLAKADGVEHRAGAVDDIRERQPVAHHVPGVPPRLRGDPDILEH